jgi:hypothetical protein
MKENDPRITRISTNYLTKVRVIRVIRGQKNGGNMKKGIVFLLTVFIGLMFVFASEPGTKLVNIKDLDLSGNPKDIPSGSGVKPDIDLKVYGIEKQIEYDWIVKPGGNPGT